MFTRLRSSTAALAALIAVACAPSPVLAADPDARQELCAATTQVTLAAMSISQSDKATQDAFIAWFKGLPLDMQVFLAQYFKYAILVYHNTGSIEQAGQEVYAVCMGRRA